LDERYYNETTIAKSHDSSLSSSSDDEGTKAMPHNEGKCVERVFSRETSTVTLSQGSVLIAAPTERIDYVIDAKTYREVLVPQPDKAATARRKKLTKMHRTKKAAATAAAKGGSSSSSESSSISDDEQLLYRLAGLKGFRWEIIEQLHKTRSSVAAARQAG